MLDKHSPIPIYYQLQKIILEKIDKGVWPPKTRIPSERELAEQFSVSRMTMRVALAELTRMGVLSREMGRGTFVTEPHVTQGLNRLTGFSDDMRAIGKQPGARVLNTLSEIAPPNLASRLQIEPTETIVIVERLRLADDEPMSIERSHIYFPHCQELLKQDLSGSLYEIFRLQFNILPTKARQQINAGLSNRRESQLLEVKLRSPVLRLFRLTLDQNQRPFEFVELVYRGDRYTFDAEMIINTQPVLR